MHLHQWIVPLLIITLIGCSISPQTDQPDSFAPVLLAVAVQNLEESLPWYLEKLGFELEKEVQEYPDYGLSIAFLQLDQFHLELIDYTKSDLQANVLPNPNTMISGVFKLGLAVNDIQATYDRLKALEGINWIADLGQLPENSLPIDWPTQHFLIQDPDDNFIQFFDGGPSEVPAPWLFMITVDNLDQSIDWYSQHLGFTHYQTVGEVGNQRAILERNQCILELFAPNEVLRTTLIPSDSLVLGFRKVAFGLSDTMTLNALSANNNVQTIMPLGATDDILWANRAMIVADPDGNWTQLFETTGVQ